MSGSLCVISDFGTFFSPAVTFNPLFNWAKTAFISVEEAFLLGSADLDVENGGGGGPGGGLDA